MSQFANPRLEEIAYQEESKSPLPSQAGTVTPVTKAHFHILSLAILITIQKTYIILT